MSTRAALYVRASTENQNYSSINQRRVLADYAEAHALSVVRTYTDDGRSGLDLAGRPGLRQLLADVLVTPCPFDALLVFDVSRWGRFQDPDESAHYEFLCRRAGVQVHYCAEPFENDGSPMSNMLKMIKRQMAGDFSRDLSKKVAYGKRRLAELGFRQGGRRGYGFERMLIDRDGQPKGLLKYGERKSIQSDRVICIIGDERERDLVRRIFRLFTADRLGETQIAALLNEEGIAAPAGGRWSNGAINFVLTDERYVGTLVYGRSTTRGIL